ncbi:MAG TPA: histidinol-phosphate transaminase [Anaeromyxobacteraceae bacterium]|nr:histidinol-phosphate transaminase [Anaeromyxobacteraceae bacterium]
MSWFKSHLERLSAYPYKKVEAAIKLDQNESPWDLPAELKDAALRRLRAVEWNRYPDIHAASLRDALARAEGWPVEGVVLAPGSNFLVLALGLMARQVLDTSPSFAWYQGSAQVSGVPYRAVPLGEDFALPLPALLEAMGDPPGVLFLANPHAPTGRLFEEEAVRLLAGRAAERGWLLVVDEAYQAFAGSDHRALARGNASVALLRTFSKAWRLGGVRAGCLLAAPEVAARVQAVLPPFCMPLPTQAVLEVALAAPEEARRNAERLAAERERIFRELSRHPAWRPHQSRANFLLVRTPDAEAAFRGLLERGILVRRQDHLPGCQGCFRVSVGTPEENDAFLRAAFALG